MKKKCLIAIVLLLLLSFTGFTISYSVEENLSKPRETISAAISINYYPGYGASVTKAVLLYFENVRGLPLALDSPAFKDGLIQVDIFLVPWGIEGNAIRTIVTFDLSVENETANRRASEICDMVMKAINQTDLPTFFRKTYINFSMPNSRDVLIDKGFLPRRLESIEGLLRYRPRGGFADLITEKLLLETTGEIVRKEANGSWVEDLELNELRYTLKKINDGFYWIFWIGFDIQTALQDSQWTEHIDLNELLLKEGPIEPSEERISTIAIKIPKRHSIPIGTYCMSLESIHPATNLKEDEANIEVIYENITEPIDNVNITIRVGKEANTFNWNATIAVAVIAGVILTIAGALLVKRKRKRGEMQ